MISKELLNRCRQKLLKTRSDLLNQIQTTQHGIAFTENRRGDEADQTVRLLEEKDFLNRNERINSRLMVVDLALARMEQGHYGICEETGEQIEPERLLAIPWTSLSIEGAEIRESMKKQYARR